MGTRNDSGAGFSLQPAFSRPVRTFASLATGRLKASCRLKPAPQCLLLRWLKFNAVGAIGIGVQLAALAVLKALLHVGILRATAAAVEIAVLHNFVWHERWTWKDRGGSHVLMRLARFNLTTGALSIVSNLLCMRLLVGQLHMQYLAANLLAIAVTSIANFLLSEMFVFR